METILDYLKKIQTKGVIFYINPVTPDTLASYISGVSKGFVIGRENISHEKFLSARSEAIALRGWTDSAAHPRREMKEKGLSDEEIMSELVEIEIATWKQLDS